MDEEYNIDQKDSENELDEFHSTRYEVHAAGLNLTSVLNNPRETFLQEVWDEFEYDQSWIEEYIPTAIESCNVNHVIGYFSQIKNLSVNFENSRLASSSSYISPSSAYRFTSCEELLRRCYEEVPRPFFNSQFAINSTSFLDELLTSNNPFDPISNLDEEEEQLEPQHPLSPSLLSSHQYKLEYMLDLVEIALFRQITAKSQDFFHALKNLQELQKSVTAAVERIETLKGRMEGVNAEVGRAQKVPQLYRKMNNKSSLQRVLGDVRSLKSVLEEAMRLAEEGDSIRSLKVIRDGLELGDKLKGVSIVVPIQQRLVSLSQKVHGELNQRFLEIAVNWEVVDQSKEEEEEVNSPLFFHQDGNQPPHGVERKGEEMRGILAITARDEKLPTLFNSYKKRFVQSVRMVIRTVVLNHMASFDPTAPAPGFDIFFLVLIFGGDGFLL